MPAMIDTDLPLCCGALSDAWPFARLLPGARLISTYFDPAQLAPTDFATVGVPEVRGVAKRQAEHLAGRFCAREALRQVTGIASVPAVGADRSPQWPAQVSGSITHSHGWAAAIVAPRSHWRGLGLDAEHLLASKRAEGLATEILTPGELQRLHGQTAEQRALHISLTFSLKESLFKALYPLVHKHFYFQDAELLDLDPDQGSARLRLLIELSEEWPAGSELSGLYVDQEQRLLSLVAVPA
ncbi:4'-phosphopantetheinyl transferase [Pseudomonas daroniae]|uniref:Enterobactin synthase component D n=2 Tax=Pseudomonadales TaxID=72274 RepID=A0A4Q9QS06_9GAMM|nr:4'-phosphopantetheinyl transferase [Pseudomonas daroniae]TBU84895.1 4'-phosphopantetheinyl transferase [Pseudomonas sp. FRB 228]TBU93812.1 4'-phosphopantetheinyl transferase [Pseudomonas daroniae]